MQADAAWPAGGEPRLRLALPAGTAAPAWLSQVLPGLERQPAPGAGLQAAAAPAANPIAAAPSTILLHTALDTTARLAAPEPATEPNPGTPATLHWVLCDSAGRLLDRQQPLLADITAGNGIALACWQRDPASGRWQLRGTLHVAASAHYARGAAGLAAAVRRLLAGALTALRLGNPLPPASLAAPAPAAALGSVDAFRRRAAGSARARWQRLRALWLSESWRVGLIDAPVAQLLRPGPLPPVRWLTRAGAAGYWADPFGLPALPGQPDGPQRLACEYFDRASGVGRLECLTLGSPGQPPERRALAVGGGGHASFPHICCIDGQRLGVAETLATRSCMLHAVADDGSWQPLWPLLEGVAAADPALFQWQGRYWLAYTDTALGAQDNLCLQHADSLRGPWQPHAANPVKVDVAGARMAGSLFWHDGALHRPAQDCLRDYGAAVVLHRIDTLTPLAFEETAVHRLAPDPAGPCPHGLHTVSAWGQRTLIDGKRLTLQPAALLRKLGRRGRVGRWSGANWSGAPHGPNAPTSPSGPGAPNGQLDGLYPREMLDASEPPAARGAAPGSIFVYVPHLRTGGGELSMLELAAGFAAAGRPVTLVVHTGRTQELALPPGVQLLRLGCEGTAAALWRLARALGAAQPQWLLSAFPHSNVAAVAAVALARLAFGCETRCVLSEHAPVSLQIAQHGSGHGGRGWRYRVLPPLLRWAYPRAAAVVAVSDGVRRDLLALGPRIDPVVIRNPVLPPTLEAELAQPPDHPWLRDPALQVVLSVGRLADEKDLPTLLRAFRTLHAGRPASRLLLAGEGPERARLSALVDTLGLQQVVQLPGRTVQPLRWMRRAAVLVLASRFEGFGNVLVEALACGTPVVATDCPVGPREILQGGRYGALVPVGNAAAMAAAIAQALQQGRTLPAGAREAALQHTRARASAAYLALFDRLAAAAATRAAPC